MRVWKLLEINVVKQSSEIPQMRILLKERRVAFHRGRNHQSVKTLIGILNVSLEQGLRFGFGRESHGKNCFPLGPLIYVERQCFSARSDAEIGARICDAGRARSVQCPKFEN